MAALLSSAAMTHVFVAPHPDDAALSCGGLIVGSPRARPERHDHLGLLRRAGLRGELTEYQREALGFGTKAMWPNYQAFRRTNIAAEYPVGVDARGRAPWMADPERIERDAGRTRTRRRASSGSARRGRAARTSPTRRRIDRPIADSVPGQGIALGGRLRGRRCRRGPPGGGRALRLVHRVVGGLPGPARCRLPRLRGRRPAPRPPSATTIRRHTICCARRSSGSSPSRSTSRWVSAATSTISSAATSAWRMLAEPRAWVMPGPAMVGCVTLLRGLPVRLVERLHGSRPTG